MPNKSTFTLMMSEKQTQVLRNLAQNLGYTIRHGPMAGQGSVQQMVNAITDGRVWLLPNPYASYVRSRRDAAALRQIADSVERRELLELAALLRALADQMD